MLILSRNEEECIVIDEGKIRLKILSVRGKKIKIGIDAPKDVTIDRLEIHNKKLLEDNVVDLPTIKDGGSNSENGVLQNKTTIKYVQRRKKIST